MLQSGGRVTRQSPATNGGLTVAPMQGASARCMRAAKPGRHQMRAARLSTVSVKAIGFDFGDREPAGFAAPPRARNSSKMANIGTFAASLLVLQPVMKGAVAEAFLACLTATKKYQASNKDVIASYSKFYGMLLAAGYDSWQDYLLDQLLMGRDSPIARNAAQGTLEEGSPILTALAHDLDVLQAIAIDLSELADYVSEMAPLAGPEWVAAASATSMKRATKRITAGRQAPVEALELDRTSTYITRPPTADELTRWKDAISGRERWSEAVQVVLQYWHLHGFGITSRNAALRWVKGALDEAPDPLTSNTNTASAPTAASVAGLGPLSVLKGHQDKLAANTIRHCEGGPGAQHVLVAGPSGTGKTWLLWDSTIAAGRERGVRVVDLSGADATTILEAARGCARYPRIRFVLVADHVDLPMRGAAAAEMMQALTTAGPGGWPSNTLLYMGATPTSTITLDPVVSRFGLTFFTKSLSPTEYGMTLKEIAAQRMSMQGSEAGNVEDMPAEKLQEAVEWGQNIAGGLTVRAASQYLTRYFSM